MTKAFFFRCHDKITCCRIPGSHSLDAESLEAAIAQLPRTWVPWEAYAERGNQLDLIPNQTLLNACKAAGKYSR